VLEGRTSEGGEIVTDAPIGAPSVLIFGEPGSGKTTALITLLLAGLEVFVIITEPNGLDSLLDACSKSKAPIDKLHWRFIGPTPVSISTLKTQAQKINDFSFEDLTKIKGDTSKRTMQQWMRVLDTLEDFKDDRTGQSFGNVGTWGPDRALAIDSLSGLNMMARDWTVGVKPMMAMGEYGVAMHMIQRLVNTCTSLDCFFILTAHVSRSIDAVKGGTMLSLLTLGEKYTPPIPAPFSEVIYAYKDGSNFYWSTATLNIATKNRALPLSDKLAPNFAPIIEVGKKRTELVQQSKPAQIQPAPTN
jgi:hypothetical protein